MLKTLIGTTDPQNYTKYLNEKIDKVVNLLKEHNLDLPSFEVFESPAEYYRMRTEFSIFFNEDHTDFSFCRFQQPPQYRLRLR